jgi:NCS1 family nucleobase:cation symporter-1
MGAVWGGWGNVPGNTAITFMVFWLIQVVIIWFGVEGVKWFEAFSGGWNWRAIAAVFAGVIPVLPGFIKAATTPGFAGVFENPTFVESLYNYGLFFTLVVAGIVYLILTLATGATEPTREAGREPETA